MLILQERLRRNATSRVRRISCKANLTVRLGKHRVLSAPDNSSVILQLTTGKWVRRTLAYVSGIRGSALSKGGAAGWLSLANTFP